MVVGGGGVATRRSVAVETVRAFRPALAFVPLFFDLIRSFPTTPRQCREC